MSNDPSPIPTAVLDRMAVRDPTLVAETAIAWIWQVTRHDDTPAALKIYKADDTQDEAAGFDLLAAQDGQGAAKLYSSEGAAFLMEWLDGPTLGDIARGGDDDTASHALVDTANRLHQMPVRTIPTLDPLENRFQTLFDTQYAPACPPDIVATLRVATDLAQRLVTHQSAPRPLHGDLHHDNIKGSARGFLAFDAKGVLGDRHFELANAFRNPLGAEDYTLKPETILRRADIWAAGFDSTPKILLSWAAALGALSLAWDHKGTFDASVTERTAYIATLLALIAAT